MTDHTGNSDGKSCRGYGKKQIIGRKNPLKYAQTVCTDQMSEWNRKEDTNEFAENSGNAKDSHAADH